MTASTTVNFRLDLGDVRRLPVSVDLAPQATLVQLPLNAAAPAPPTPLALAVRRSLDSSARFAVSCLSDPRVRAIPDVVMPLRPGERASVAAQTEALRSTPGDVLVDQCLALWGPNVPAV